MSHRSERVIIGVWAVEGSNGAGRPLAQRLLEDGENVVDGPANLAARVRLFDTGHNRVTDAYGTHATHGVAVVAVRSTALRVLVSTVSSRPSACSPTTAKHSTGAGPRPSSGSRPCRASAGARRTRHRHRSGEGAAGQRPAW